MNVNYLAEIIAFERWLETNYLPIPSQLLWYKLMSIFNRSGWSEWVVIENLKLMAAMQMGREATLINVRNELIKAGLITYQKGKKGSPNRYKMIYFTFKREVQSEVQREVQSEVYPVVQEAVESADIYKQNKTETKEKDTNVSKKSNPVKHRMGEYGHVTLSDEEFQKLKKEYGDLAQEAIKYLDEYVEMKGYKHKSSYLAIRKWVIDAVKEQKEKAGRARGSKDTSSPKKTGFQNFEERNTDYDAMVLERLRGRLCDTGK